MVRKSFLGWVIVAAAAPIVFMSAVWASSTAPVPPTEDIHPEQGYPLDCDGGLAIAYHGDFSPKDEKQRKASPSAKDPDEAVSRHLASVYPAAPQKAVARVREGENARFEAKGDSRGRAAVFAVAKRGGEYYVEDVAICESLAKKWAK